jgi:hypothetical protein
VVQHLDLASLDIPVVCPDMTGQEFDKGWRGVPFWQRLALWCALPVFILVVFLFGSRARLAHDLVLDDDHGLGGYEEGLE